MAVSKRYLHVRSSLGAVLFILGLLSCSQPQRIDCKKLEDTLLKCTPSIAERAPADRRGELYQGRFAAQVQDSITPLCHLHEGRFEDASKINECLAKPSCDAFATCILSLVHD